MMTFTIGVPQIIWILIVIWSAVYSILHHGEPETGKKSAWTIITSQIIMTGLMYWGGFFG